MNTPHHPHDIPPEALAVLREQNLELIQIWRGGPRFFTALVRMAGIDGQPGPEGVLKVVLDDWPWQRRSDQSEWHSSDQLLAEADVLQALQHHRHRIAGHIPSILEHKRDRPAWTLRSMVYGRAIELAANGFGFDPATWRPNDTSRLVRFIRDYQKVSLDLPDLARVTSKSEIQHMSAWVRRLGLDDPPAALTAMGETISSYLTAAVPWIETLPRVLVHGEVYPMHIYVKDADVALIDWENAQRGNELIDLVTFWIRGSTMPEWQEDFKRQVAASETMLPPADFEKLWDFMVVSSATGTIRHLELAPEVTPVYRSAAIASLAAAITAALQRA